jgi:hypothetical protein
MGKIVRLTESDLVRIVKRVINEGLSSTLMAPLTVGGKTYQVQLFGRDTVAFVSKNDVNTEIKDRDLIGKLNTAAGFAYEAIPTSTGTASVGYIKNHCFKYGNLCSKLP